MRASIRLHEPVAKHMSVRTGGPCDAWVVAHDEEAVTTVLADCKEVGWNVLTVGRGTRLVVRDGGVEGVVLRLGSGFGSIEVDGEFVTAGGAASVPAVLATAAQHGLAADRARLVVPGSFGASVLHDDWELTEARVARPAKRSSQRVRVLDNLPPRTKGVVMQGTVRLEQVGREEAVRRFRAALRRSIVPAGSWVKDDRPVRDILRKASLDRVRLRAVAIPEEAPELLINLGGGTARDLRLLHRSALERVKRIGGVELTPAVRWVGHG